MATNRGQKFLNHTCFRIADPKRSIDFYEKHFGMTLLKTLESKNQGFSKYVLGLAGPTTLYKNEPFFARGGLLQLAHQHTSTVENFKANNGNQDPGRGFGHICFTVPDIDAFCERLESAGVKFQKRLKDGNMKFLAFVLDPDGYWIELVPNGQDESGGPTDNLRLNHSMIRVKDKDASLQFYKEKLGMSLVDTMDFPQAKFSLFFLSFDPEGAEAHGKASIEGIVELTYNYESEKDDKVSYHTGNTEPLGFSHFGISVDEPEKFVEGLKAQGVEVVPTTLATYEGVQTITDPDGYAIQVLPKTDYTISGKI